MRYHITTYNILKTTGHNRSRLFCVAMVALRCALDPFNRFIYRLYKITIVKQHYKYKITNISMKNDWWWWWWLWF